MDLVALHIFKTVAEAGGITKAAARLHRVQSNITTRVPPLLSRYHLAYPEVRLELVTGTSGALVARVLSGDIEAAFVAEPFTAQGLDTQLAFSEELVLIAPKGYPVIRSAKDAAHLPLLAFAAGCSYRCRLESWLGRSGVSPERVMEYGSYHAIVACVAAGAGIAVVPKSIIRAVRPEREVRIYPLPKDIAAAKTQLVWRQGHRSSALEALKSELLAAPSTRAAASPASRSAVLQ